MEEQLAKPIHQQVELPEGAPVSQELGGGRKVKVRLAALGFVLFLIFVVGLFWLATTPEQTVGLTLAFAAGLSMIFLPCTLPMAFVIVPMAMGKNPKKGFLMALFFGLGLTLTLSFYGVFIAALGKILGLTAATQGMLMIGGGAAFLFGLSEIRLLKFRIPSYSGNFPAFIQKRGDYVKTFLLGLFLGNAGVGCPNPAFYVLLGYIASVGDLFNGWFLGFVHGAGRAVPLIFLAILGILGVNATGTIAKKKEVIEKYTGWMLIVIGAFILTFGLFGHDWFIAGGIHNLWEQFVANVGGAQFGEIVLKHEHKLIDIPGFIKYGNLFMLGLIALTMIWYFIKQKPGRKTVAILVAIFTIILGIVGVATGWTFMTGKGVHLGEEGAPSETKDGQLDSTKAVGEKSVEARQLVVEEGSVREGLVVNLNYSPLPASTGQTTRLDFFVNEKPGNKPVTDLEITDEKFIHVIGMRDDLEEFFHLHPEADAESPELWSIERQFENPGTYKLWTDVKRGGMTYTFSHPEISVKGEGSTQTEEEMSFVKSLVVGNDELGKYQVLIEYDEPIVPGRKADLVFSVNTTTGTAELAPFLGEEMQLTIIKEDLKWLMNLRPEQEKPQEQNPASFIPVAYANGEDVHDDDQVDEVHKGISFHVTFPESGAYKAFAQFRPKDAEFSEDEALTAGFWIRVDPGVAVGVEEEEKVISKSAQWWGLLIASLILMTLLSLGVHKYLQVKAPVKKGVEPKVETPPASTEKSPEKEPETST
ncbi:cytochrome c biogenesis protein CcdA [Patescibacteria group bacterium]|nr:cytochrome c biogenesis protein CcdA [Patescibacteria group bacterium]